MYPLLSPIPARLEMNRKRKNNVKEKKTQDRKNCMLPCVGIKNLQGNTECSKKKRDWSGASNQRNQDLEVLKVDIELPFACSKADQSV
jgi:hypothetical protein